MKRRGERKGHESRLCRLFDAAGFETLQLCDLFNQMCQYGQSVPSLTCREPVIAIRAYVPLEDHPSIYCVDRDFEGQLLSNDLMHHLTKEAATKRRHAQIRDHMSIPMLGHLVGEDSSSGKSTMVELARKAEKVVKRK